MHRFDWSLVHAKEAADGFGFEDRPGKDVAYHAAALSEFRAWIAARPERRICLVGHNNIFADLVGFRCRFANCAPVICRICPDTLTFVPESWGGTS